jgi:hypothetical protein
MLTFKEGCKRGAKGAQQGMQGVQKERNKGCNKGSRSKGVQKECKRGIFASVKVVLAWRCGHSREKHMHATRCTRCKESVLAVGVLRRAARHPRGEVKLGWWSRGRVCTLNEAKSRLCVGKSGLDLALWAIW